MESLLEPVELNRETAQALDEIRSGAENALYGVASADAEEKLNHFVLPLIEGSGLPNLHVMHYRWYLREVTRHWRTRKGRDLAFHLELCIRKWVGLGLEPRTLQFLICEAHQRLKGKENSEVRNQNAETRSTDARSEASQSAESAKSADVRGPDPKPASTTKTPSHEEAAAESPTAPASPQDPRTPEPQNPGVGS
jgi:hypothetical protein